MGMSSPSLFFLHVWLRSVFLVLLSLLFLLLFRLKGCKRSPFFMAQPDPFFRILQIAATAIRAGLEFYAKRTPADMATANRTKYVLDCLDAVINRRPLPVLGAPGKG